MAESSISGPGTGVQVSVADDWRRLYEGAVVFHSWRSFLCVKIDESNLLIRLKKFIESGKHDLISQHSEFSKTFL